MVLVVTDKCGDRSRQIGERSDLIGFLERFSRKHRRKAQTANICAVRLEAGRPDISVDSIDDVFEYRASAEETVYP